MRIVFLHGIGGLASGFDEHIAWFKDKGINALAINCPGYGGEPTLEPYNFTNITKHLIKTMASDRNDTIIVGHSMGGMLAQLIASADAQKSGGLNLKGLVLAHTSPAFGNQDGDFQQKFISSRTARLNKGQTMLDVARELVPSMVGPNCSAQRQEQCVAMMSQVPELTYREALSALVTFDARPQLQAITVPTLCLAAEHDKTAPPAMMEKLAAKLPNAKYYCLPALGHLAPIEDPQQFCQAIESFCSNLN
jgi:3-oxoadipate enol-lactonase